MTSETTPPHVARHATIQAPLDQHQLILLGIFGAESDLKALLRLPDGDIRRVETGDQVQGVTVLAIAPDHIAMGQGSVSRRLRIPGTQATAVAVDEHLSPR